MKEKLFGTNIPMPSSSGWNRHRTPAPKVAKSVSS